LPRSVFSITPPPPPIYRRLKAKRFSELKSVSPYFPSEEREVIPRIRNFVTTLAADAARRGTVRVLVGVPEYDCFGGCSVGKEAA
jgi:hypothetical protein